MRKLFIYFASTVIALVFTWVSFPYYKASAANSNDLIGWAWSENIGWISFNSKNCDSNNNGVSDGIPSGCPTAGTVMAQYAVTRASNGDLSGYAWTENIGWIKFDPNGPYPGGPNRSSRIRSGQAGDGWFRAIANDASWDGWMKLNSGGNYGSGVTIGGAQNNTLQGYAWGSTIVGWIHMSGTNYQVNIGGGQVTNLNANLTASGAACGATPQPTISWSYTDADSLPQAAYQVQIATDSAFNNIVPNGDTGKVPSTSNSFVVPGNTLSYSTAYYYRVRVWNSSDIVSPYTQSAFTTTHRGPNVAFIWAPTKPNKNQATILTDQTTTSGGAGISSRSWTFPGSATLTTPPPTDATETATFVDQTNPITLSVTDSDSITCSLQQTLTTLSPILQFQEIAPQ